MVNANVVIDVFNSCIDGLSSLLDTSVGAWVGGFLVLGLVFKAIKCLQTI